MSKIVKSIMKKAKETVKPRAIKVISICSVCGEPVNANKNYLAPRHGFKRYRKKRITKTLTTPSFSQEDDRPCRGSGKEVLYKRSKK